MNLFWKIWLIPIVIGFLTLTGLLSALLGVGIWHWVSWLSFTIVVSVAAFAIYSAKHSHTS